MAIIQKVPQTVEDRAARDAQIKAALAALEREPVPAALVIDATRADWVGTRTPSATAAVSTA